MINENGQNGFKVFASIAKFGETKFKPIRKQENLLTKSTFQSSSNKRKVEQQAPPPTNRVNKFFKSRNVGAVLEEDTNKPNRSINVAKITPIKNETIKNETPKYKEAKYKEPKALKIKIKKEKKVIEKVIKPPKQVKQRIEPDSPPRIKLPNLSNQTRYSTRSRRSNDSEVNNEIGNVDLNQHQQLEQNEHQLQQNQHYQLQSNQHYQLEQNQHQIESVEDTQQTELINQVQEVQEQLHATQLNQSDPLIETPPKKTRGRKPVNVYLPKPVEVKPVHQYGTRRSRKAVNEEPVNNEDLNYNNQIDSTHIPQATINSNIDLDDNNLEDLNCINQKEIKFDQNLRDQDFRQFFSDDKDDERVFTPSTEINLPVKSINNDIIEQEELQFSSSQPTFVSSSQKSDDPLDNQQFSFSQPTSSLSTAAQTTVNQPRSNLNALPQKKRFFSKTDKEKKVQYNVKNFFANKDANEFDDEDDPEKVKSSQESKVIEFDSDKLKKVKEAYKCAELGEAEHFDGEINFYLSGIKDKTANSISMRCLSIIGLTGQFLNKPELRMHLRAHDYMGKIIRALMDSPKNPNLALCSACLMFVYNQDRLTMDIDPNALRLMLELLETKSDETIQIEDKHKNKITEMCKTMKNKGHGKYLKLNEISAGTLAMETLLGLTSKRAGDWCKEELRKLKGIDYLIDNILTASSSENNEYMQEEAELNKIDRSLRVIENVTCENKENQQHVIDYGDNVFIKRCIKLYELCRDGIMSSETTNHYLSPLLSILRVFTNLTSDSQGGCAKIGSSIPEIFNIFLNSVFELPSHVVPDSRFDLTIFLLCLCLNLIESCDQLHNEFINNQYQIKRLIVMLEERSNEANKTEQQADDFLKNEEQRQKNLETINIDSILTDLVAKSGKHMEHTIIAACISLLIGCGLKGKDLMF